MASMNREEYKAADALSKAVAHRGFMPHGFIIRLGEFPSYIQREIWNLFILWMRVMAKEAGNQYSVWPDDIKMEASAIWREAQHFYGGDDEPV
jgi:hypothetical protein